MRTITFTLLAAFICFSSAPFTAAEEPRNSPKPEAPEGWIVIEESYFMPFDDEPDIQFNKARENFLKRDSKSAAKAIRKSITFLEIEAIRAPDKGKIDVRQSIAILRKLADKLEADTHITVEEMDMAFSRAHKSLAGSAYLKASAAWSMDKAPKAGEYLRGAARYFELAFIWSGHEIEAGTEKSITEARLLAGKMIEGSGWVSEKVGTTLEALGNSIEELAKKIEPAQKP